jgi:peptidoglycan/LPS O-acetylase OafA/YrhL
MTMTATTVIVPTAGAPTTRPAIRQSAPTKQLWKPGVVAGLVAAVATSTVAAAAKALDVPIEVGGKAIPLLGFAQLTFVGALIGTILAVVLSYRASRPRRTFLITTVALTLLSIVPDVLADAHTATRFTLALTHVVAAAIVIPALSSRLSD